MNRNQIERKQCMDRIDYSITNADDKFDCLFTLWPVQKKVTCEYVVGSEEPDRMNEFR